MGINGDYGFGNGDLPLNPQYQIPIRSPILNFSYYFFHYLNFKKFPEQGFEEIVDKVN